jgi:chemotaxis protein MotB
MKRDEPIIIVKKVKGGHGGHHGGAWKVAYADFVTAMMALFIVLWLLSQTDQSMREKLSQYFRTGVLSGSTSVLNGGTGVEDKGFLDVKGADGENEMEKLSNAAENIRDAINALKASDADFKALGGQIKVTVSDFGLLIQIMDGGDDLIFDVSSAELKPPLVRVLTKLAPLLAKLDNTLQVHGHTDNRPFPAGSTRSNWSLSFERADRARGVLEKAGVRPGQITGVFAHGANAPLVKDGSAPANRRLAIMAVRRGFESAVAYGEVKNPVM